MKTPFADEFIGLLFPKLCNSCGRALFAHETAICTACLHLLPKTRFHLDPESNADQVFWGRVQLEKVSACYYYTRHGKVQKLVHALKYGGMTMVGRTIGECYGRELKSSPLYRDIDLIIPVPLHPRKKRKRGFNQSEIFSQGLAQSMELPVDSRQLYRRKATGTQTRRSRYSRWTNVEGIFSLREPGELNGKNILLADDVITTGATIEACANALQRAGNVKIWVAAIGFATM